MAPAPPVRILCINLSAKSPLLSTTASTAAKILASLTSVTNSVTLVSLIGPSPANKVNFSISPSKALKFIPTWCIKSLNAEGDILDPRLPTLWRIHKAKSPCLGARQFSILVFPVSSFNIQLSGRKDPSTSTSSVDSGMTPK